MFQRGAKGTLSVFAPLLPISISDDPPAIMQEVTWNADRRVIRFQKRESTHRQFVTCSASRGEGFESLSLYLGKRHRSMLQHRRYTHASPIRESDQDLPFSSRGFHSLADAPLTAATKVTQRLRPSRTASAPCRNDTGRTDQ